MSEISVIIPVYNTGKYLAECLDSVIAQTFSDIEIICVNDSSTDNSSEILQQYAKRDLRISVIDQPNSGVVVARNNGISHATGKFIYPLDSDDIITTDCLEKLYNKITRSGYRVVMSQAQKFGRINGIFQQPDLTKLEMYGWHENCIISALFYKEDFIKFGGYCVDFNRYGGDDMDYWLNYMDNNMPMTRLPEVLFFYRQKDDTESVWKNYNETEKKQRYNYKEQKLQERHPKMRVWICIYKIMHNKIVRFFFCKQNKSGRRYVRLLKIISIPVSKKIELKSIKGD